MDGVCLFVSISSRILEDVSWEESYLVGLGFGWGWVGSGWLGYCMFFLEGV